MAKLTKEQQSAIGRRSRAKGKRFERRVAALLREWTGADWQTTRNSGRTDLKGDVYVPDCPEADGILVECKDRKAWTLKAVAQRRTMVAQELDSLVRAFIAEAAYQSRYTRLLVFVSLHGDILVGWRCRGGMPGLQRSRRECFLMEVGGLHWMWAGDVSGACTHALLWKGARR